ncbi:hypothetical protein FRC19_005303 [Serendipita sp. 401]|nr:hypothetical protein FRC19_005303 [Serendipita sp. 401]
MEYLEYFDEPPKDPKLPGVDCLQPSRSQLLGYLSNLTDGCQTLEKQKIAMNLLLYVAYLKGGGRDYHWKSVELSIHELMDEAEARVLPKQVMKVRVVSSPATHSLASHCLDPDVPDMHNIYQARRKEVMDMIMSSPQNPPSPPTSLPPESVFYMSPPQSPIVV